MILGSDCLGGRLRRRLSFAKKPNPPSARRRIGRTFGGCADELGFSATAAACGVDAHDGASQILRG